MKLFSHKGQPEAGGTQGCHVPHLGWGVFLTDGNCSGGPCSVIRAQSGGQIPVSPTPQPQLHKPLRKLGGLPSQAENSLLASEIKVLGSL